MTRLLKVGPVAAALTALVTGEIAARYGLRPEPFYLGIAFAALGLGLSTVFVRETREVTSTDTLPVHLAAGGGQAIRFVPMDPPVR